MWENRNIGCLHPDEEVFKVSVDCTDCRIEEPPRFDGKKGVEKAYSSHKFGKKAALRYEIALAIWSDCIVHVKGPLPAGAWQDLKIYKELGLAEKINNAGEKAVADGIYRHPTVSQKGVGNSGWRLHKNQIRARHER